MALFSLPVVTCRPVDSSWAVTPAMPADQRPVRPPGPVGVLHRGDVLTQAEVAADARDHHARDVVQAREVPRPAEAWLTT
jgi:hypothetical protein